MGNATEKILILLLRKLSWGLVLLPLSQEKYTRIVLKSYEGDVKKLLRFSTWVLPLAALPRAASGKIDMNSSGLTGCDVLYY